MVKLAVLIALLSALGAAGNDAADGTAAAAPFCLAIRR
jgi:hypothetical protein